MKRRRLLGILVIFFSLVMLNAWAVAQVVEVRGVVTGKENLPKAQVSIRFNGPQRYIAISNAQGEFSLKGIQPGVYEIIVSQRDKMQRFSMQITGDNLDLRVPW